METAPTIGANFKQVGTTQFYEDLLTGHVWLYTGTTYGWHDVTRYDHQTDGDSLRYMREWGMAIKAETIICKFHEAFASTMVSGATRLSPIWIPDPITITEFCYFQKTTGDFTNTTAQNNMSLYSLDMSTKVATLVADTGNVTDLWKRTASTVQRIPLSGGGSYNAGRGWHYIGFRYAQDTQVTAPTISARGLDGTGSSIIDGVRLAATTTSNLPATIDVSTASGTSQSCWGALN